MNGPIAQIVALTCHGNARIAGKSAPEFFPGNSTCQFCDSVTFVELRKPLLRPPREVEVAATPDEWLASLLKRGVKGIRLMCEPQNVSDSIPDRMSAGFVGGGGTWMIEVLRKDGHSDYWAARWEVWNQDAPERRIWRVRYGLLATRKTEPDLGRSLVEVKEDFVKRLQAIYSFSCRENCGGFSECFAKALVALDDPKADVGYHKDLAPDGVLGDEARSLLKAAMSAWVFGGMGSWNDMGFQGESQEEYESVSEDLFRSINEAIEVAATSTFPS